MVIWNFDPIIVNVLNFEYDLVSYCWRVVLRKDLSPNLIKNCFDSLSNALDLGVSDKLFRFITQNILWDELAMRKSAIIRDIDCLEFDGNESVKRRKRIEFDFSLSLFFFLRMFSMFHYLFHLIIFILFFSVHQNIETIHWN